MAARSSGRTKALRSLAFLKRARRRPRVRRMSSADSSVFVAERRRPLERLSRKRQKLASTTHWNKGIFIAYSRPRCSAIPANSTYFRNGRIQISRLVAADQIEPERSREATHGLDGSLDRIRRTRRIAIDALGGHRSAFKRALSTIGQSAKRPARTVSGGHPASHPSRRLFRATMHPPFVDPQSPGFRATSCPVRGQLNPDRQPVPQDLADSRGSWRSR